MKKRVDYILVLLSIVVIIFTIHTLRKPPVRMTTDLVDLTQVKRVWPSAERVLPPESPGSWSAVRDNTGKQLGAVIVTSPEADDIRGYAGPTPLLIAVDEQGIIREIIPLDSAESPEFVEMVLKTDFFNPWKGKPWKEATRIQADAVSGATLTSNAFARTLTKRISLLDPSIEVPKSPAAQNTLWIDIGILALLIGGFFLCFGKVKNQGKLKYVLMVISVIFLGFLTASCFSVTLLSSWIINGIPLTTQMGLVLLVGSAVLVPILTGKNLYCFFLCPFGALQELVNKVVGKKFKIKPSHIKTLMNVRFVILIILTVSLLAGAKLNPGYLEPFSAFMFKTAGIATILIAVVSLVLACGINRPWCSFFCPAGALVELIRKPAVPGKKAADVGNKKQTNHRTEECNPTDEALNATEST